MLSKKSKQIRQNIINQGNKYGYKKCCVDAYVKDMDRGRNPGTQRRGIMRSGYVPCEPCGKKMGFKPFSPATKRMLTRKSNKYGYIDSSWVRGL